MYQKIINSFLVCVLFISCAQPVSPTGGDTDKTAPIITNTLPSANSIKTKPQKIVFSFDENIQINNPKENVIISPNPGPIRFTNNNKSLTIHLNTDSLKENITYSVYLNETILDLNENNKGIYKPLLFSLSDKIDSAKIFGKIELFTNPKIKNYKIFSYNYNHNTNKILYQNKIINGYFFLDGLDSTLKTLVAFNDINNNGIADAGDEIGLASNIKPNSDSLTIPLYGTAKNKVDFQTYSNRSFITGLQPWLRNKIVNENPQVYFYKDSLIINSSEKDIIIKYINKDFYILGAQASTVQAKSVAYEKDYATDDSNRCFYLRFNFPIDSIKINNIKLTQLSDTNKAINFTVNSIQNILRIQYSNIDEKTKIVIPKNTLFFNGAPYKTDITAYTEAPKTAGKVIISNPTKNLQHATVDGVNKQYYIDLEPGDKKALYIPRGTYTITWFLDLNRDLWLNPPDISLEIPAEPIKILKSIAVKPGLENEVILN